MQRLRVDVGVDGDRADAHLVGGAQDAHRDFASVGDEDLAKHGRDF